MHAQTRRQREALYAGIADMPLPSTEKVTERFEYGYLGKSMLTTFDLIMAMHRFRMRPARRTLHGIIAMV